MTVKAKPRYKVERIFGFPVWLIKDTVTGQIVDRSFKDKLFYNSNLFDYEVQAGLFRNKGQANYFCNKLNYGKSNNN